MVPCPPIHLFVRRAVVTLGVLASPALCLVQRCGCDEGDDPLRRTENLYLHFLQWVTQRILEAVGRYVPAAPRQRRATTQSGLTEPRTLAIQETSYWEEEGALAPAALPTHLPVADPVCK